MTPKEKYQDIDASASVLPEKALIALKELKPVLFDKKYQAEEYAAQRKKAEEKMDILYSKISKDYPDAIKSKVAKQPEPKTPQAMAQKAAKQTIKQPTVKNPKATAGANNRGNVTKLAKEIRKDGETWHAAMKRAGEMINKEKGKAVKKANVQYEKLKAFLAKNPSIEKTMVTYGKKPNQGTRPLDVKRDAARVAKPKGKRVSSEGKTYYEYRANRTDSSRKRYPYLELGGKLFGAGYFAKGGNTKETYKLEISAPNSYMGYDYDSRKGKTIFSKEYKSKEEILNLLRELNKHSYYELQGYDSKGNVRIAYNDMNLYEVFEDLEDYSLKNLFALFRKDNNLSHFKNNYDKCVKWAISYGLMKNNKKTPLFVIPYSSLNKAQEGASDYNYDEWVEEVGYYINGVSLRKLIKKYADGGEFGHTFNGAGKFSEGGYMATGEDYEYYNKFGLEQSDFEKIVEVWHMHEKTPTVEVEKQYNMVLDAMEDKYGETKIDDVVDDIYHRHGLMKIMNYAKGGKTNNGDNLPNTVEEYFAAMNNFSMRLGEAEANFANDNGASYQRVLAERDEFFEKVKAKWYAELNEAEGNFAKDGGKSYEAALKKLDDARLRFAKGGKISDVKWSNDENKRLGIWLLTSVDGNKILKMSSNGMELEKNVMDYYNKKGSVAKMTYNEDADEGLAWVTFSDLYQEVQSVYAKGGTTKGHTKYVVRQDIIDAGESVPVGNTYVSSGVYEGRYNDDGSFEIKHNGKWHEAESIDWETYAKGGEITPKVNSQMVARAEEIYANNNGSTKEDFDMAYHQAIREAGYNVEEFISTMKNIGADYGHEGDDYYAKGGEVGKKENWNNSSYQEKLNWLKKQKSLYPIKGDIFEMADVYARTPYHLLPNNVHRLIDESKEYAKGGKVKGRLSDTHKYVPNRMIQEIEVERRGKTSFIDGADILDGVYVKKGVKFAHGGTMPHIHSKKHRNG